MYKLIIKAAQGATVMAFVLVLIAVAIVVVSNIIIK
jgi:hypothetical protein